MSVSTGDLVSFKSDFDSLGIVTKVDSNIHKSVSYKLWVSWNFLNGDVKQNFSWELNVINSKHDVILGRK